MPGEPATRLLHNGSDAVEPRGVADWSGVGGVAIGRGVGYDLVVFARVEFSESAVKPHPPPFNDFA